jgi:hypothetical protein
VIQAVDASISPPFGWVSDDEYSIKRNLSLRQKF